MAIALKPGTKLYGACCTTEYVVVKAPGGEVDLQIGGNPAVTSPADRDDSLQCTPSDEVTPAMGKRYTDADETIELLCTKPGEGAAAIGDAVLAQKDAKPLPASD